VNGTVGGSAAFGAIDPTGLYTAPSVLPTPPAVVVTAVAQADAPKFASANVTVTIGIAVLPATASLNISSAQCPVTQQFGAVITGVSNTNVSWSIVANGSTVSGSDPTFGTIDATGLYAAPGTIPTQPKFNIAATSQADPTQSGSALVQVSAGGVGVDQSQQNAPVQLGT